MRAACYIVALLCFSFLDDLHAVSLAHNESHLMANFDATAWNLTLRIDVLEPAVNDSALVTTSSTPLNLESIIRTEINGDWKRGRWLMQLVQSTRSVQLKRAVNMAVWHELQGSRQIYNASRILDFYAALKQQADVPASLEHEVYVAFVQRSAQLLAAPFYTNSSNASFPLVDELLQRLTFNTLDTLRDIFEAVYDAVLSLETALSIVQRLGNLQASLAQLTTLNLQLLNRSELQANQLARFALQRNLRQLLDQPDLKRSVEASLLQQLYAQLPPDERTLYTAQKVCLRNVSDASGYLYECPQTYLLCSNAADPKRAAYYVQRAQGLGDNGTVQFAFHSAYWGNRYIQLDTNSTLGYNNTQSITKNVYSRYSIDWWLVVYVNEGVALYDAASSSRVLCAGNPLHWEDEEHHVYTRSAAYFDQYRAECVWRVEDCSDAA